MDYIDCIKCKKKLKKSHQTFVKCDGALKQFPVCGECSYFYLKKFKGKPVDFYLNSSLKFFYQIQR